jgi:prefoldin subunit 5
MSEPDIIRNLRREGYATGEIDQAMKEALRSRVSGNFYNKPMVNEYGEASLGPPPEEAPEMEDIPKGLGYPGADMTDDDITPPPYDSPAEQQREPQYPDMPEGDYFNEPAQRRPAPAMRGQTRGVDRREIEELAEVIVEEKLRELKEHFKAIDMQFQQVNRKVDSISDEMNRVRMEKSNEVKGIEAKIDGYSRNMDEINGRMESMEKALKDSLSPMLESMRSLAELVKSMKERGK